MNRVLVHHGVKGMKWGVRKEPEQKQSVKKVSTSIKVATLSTGGGGGGGGGPIDDEELLDLYSKTFKKTLKEVEKLVKKGSESVKPILKSLGGLASEATKALVEKGKKLIDSLTEKLSKRNKKAELEYNKKHLTKEEKKEYNRKAFEQIKADARRESEFKRRNSRSK